MMNINEETGIRFGFISANSLHSDVVDDLMFNFGTDLDYEEYVKENPDEEDADDYYNDEPDIEGEMEKVKYATSWLGGALHFWIFESPYKTQCALCSPCVFNVGDLGNIGEDYVDVAYDVPKEWRTEE